MKPIIKFSIFLSFKFNSDSFMTSIESVLLTLNLRTKTLFFLNLMYFCFIYFSNIDSKCFDVDHELFVGIFRQFESFYQYTQIIRMFHFYWYCLKHQSYTKFHNLVAQLFLLQIATLFPPENTKSSTTSTFTVLSIFSFRFFSKMKEKKNTIDTS